MNSPQRILNIITHTALSTDCVKRHRKARCAAFTRRDTANVSFQPLEKHSPDRTCLVSRDIVSLDEILPLQLITDKLGGSIVNLEIEITWHRHQVEGTNGFKRIFVSVRMAWCIIDRSSV